MKKFYLPVLLFISFSLSAQNTFCSLLLNGSFNSTNFLSSDPFRNGTVSSWTASHGTPIYNGIGALNGTYSPEIEADYNTFTQHIGSGIRTQGKITFIAGKQYYLVFNYRNNMPTPGSLTVGLVQNSVWGTTGNTLPLAGLTTAAIATISVGAGVTSWTRNTVCFTAPYNSADLWFYAQIVPGAALSRIGIDEVEIYKDFDFVGTPKIRYTCDLPVTLGLSTGACIPINPLPTHNWFIIPGNIPIGSSQSITVNPLVDTKYVLERNNAGCTTDDTVDVKVSHKPIFDLGNDTILCQCAALTLGINGPAGPCISYLWSNGSTGRTLIIKGNDGLPVGTLSKTYSLTITDNCTGCSYSDNIVITYKPVPHCIGRSVVVCEAELPMNLVTKGIGTGYLWARITGTGTPPSAPFTNNVLQINSIGRYVCTVTDANGPCTTGYDTITVLPWDSMPLRIVPNRIINPCYRQGLYLVNAYDDVNGWTTPLNWYKDGVFKQTSAILYTVANGTYMAELISPNGLCIKRDTFKLVFIDPPLINLPPIYGSFCKNFCDTLLKFTYCDTCGPDMGEIDTMKITWTGDGVVSRKTGSKNNFYFCAQKANCGNNILTVTIIYTKYGITCTTTVVTNAYKVCPLQLDSLGPYCANEADVYIYNQGLYITNATIQGSGVYQEAGTNKFKFSPATAGPGLHKIRYYYDDGAGCFGWDSTYVLVYGKPRINLWVTDCISGPATWNVLVYAGQADGDTYYLSSSEWVGTSTYTLGYNANYLTSSFWGSTNGSPVAGHTYWFKICSSHGCCDSVGITIGIEKPLHLSYDTTGCINSGIDIAVTYNTVNMTGINFPSNIAFSWDDEVKCNFLSATWGMDPNLPTLLTQIAGSPYFSSRALNMVSSATKKVFTLGWHKIRILTLGGCEYEDSIYIKWICGNCPITEPVNDTIHAGTTIVWSNETKVVNGNLIIESGAHLTIIDCHIAFTACSKIIVHSGGPAGIPILNYPSGTLTLSNDTLDGCPTWKGIEVWGSSDYYDHDMIYLGLGENPRTKLVGTHKIIIPGMPRTTQPWAYVYAINSVIKDADIAIFAGKYDDNAPQTFDPYHTGGMAFVNNCTFSNNYSDIVFPPRPGVGMLSGNESWNASYIVKSTFKANKTTYSCDSMYWFNINGTTNPIGATIKHVNPNCNIVDLSETIYRVPGVFAFDYNYYLGPGYFIYMNAPFAIHHPSTLKRDARVPYTVWHPMHEWHVVRNPYDNDITHVSEPIDKISLGIFINIMSNNCNNW